MKDPNKHPLTKSSSKTNTMDGEGEENEARKLQEWFKPNDHVAFNVVYGNDGNYPLFIHFGVGYFTLVICGACGAARDLAGYTSALRCGLRCGRKK